MPTEQFVNNGTATLAGTISSGATSLSVTSAAALPASGPFRLRIDSEYIYVGAISGTTLSSLTRGVEGSSAASHTAGALIRLVLTAGALLRVARDVMLSIAPRIPLDRGSRGLILFGSDANVYEDHPEWRDVTLNWNFLAGWTVQALFEPYCENATVTITPRLVLAGTSTAVATGSAHAAVSWGSDPVTISGRTGTETYRLQHKRSALTYGTRLVADLLFTPPAV